MANKINLLICIKLFLVLLLTIPISYSLDKSRKEIGANIINNFGITGKYNSICLIDDGIDYTHPNLGGCILSQISLGQCPTIIAAIDIAENDNDPSPEGSQEHGTQIAGIILSNNSKYRGIASNSKIAIVRVWDYNFTTEESFTNTSLVLDAIQWCIDNKNNYNITTISMSLGMGFGLPSDLTKQFQDKISNATSKGIVFIKSSGNREEGDNYSMTFPAELGNVTAVGSTTTNKISYFTRRTSNMDLLAPGDKIRSTIPGGGFSSFLGNIICWHSSDRIAGSKIIRGVLPFCNYGTSLAAPHVSASATLLKEFDPALKPFDIERILKETGDDIYDSVTGSTFKKINLPKAFHIYDWPTFHHDYRRTGFTLLKGDLTSAAQVRKTEWTLDTSGAPAAIAHPSIADLDRNGKQEIVVTTSKYGASPNGTVYSVERGWLSFSEKWNKNIGQPIPKAPSLENIDSDSQLEVGFGDRGTGRNSTLFILDGINGGQQWNYSVKPKYSAYWDDYTSGMIANTALVDIDLDGEKEVLFTDKQDSACDWPGELYAFSKTGNLEYNITVGNDGSEGGVSIANIFGSDYPDVIVPTKCGIKAYEFDGSKFVLKWSNTDTRIDGNAVIYDVDRDNKYEVIYTTTDASCPYSSTCYNRLYIRDAETGNNELTISLGSYISKITPAIADIIGDDNTEILITVRDSSSSNYGRVLCYHSNNGSACGYSWPYTGGGTLNTLFQAPAIADIDNDGNYNVIFGTGTLENKTYFLKENGTLLFSYQFDGQLGSSPAIGDIDGDAMAEIAIRNEGSNILTELSGLNHQPQLNDISNISANEGDLIFINESGEIWATDEDNDALTFYYSSPFNESGYWQTTINDSGYYSVLIEVSDGNLSDWQYITVEVYITDTTPPFITIIHPVNNTEYSTTSIDLNWSVNETPDWAAYSLDGTANNTEIFRGEQPSVYDDFNDNSINASKWSTTTTGDCGGVMEVYEAGDDIAMHATCPVQDKNNYAVVVGQEDMYDLNYESIYLNETFRKVSNGYQRIWITNSTTAHKYGASGYTDILLKEAQVSQDDIYSRIIFNRTNKSVIFEYDKLGSPSTTTHDLSTLNNDWYLGFEVQGRCGYGGCSPDDSWHNISMIKKTENIIQNITLTDLSEGKHNITIWANDTAGNIGQSSYVYFDVALPSDQNKLTIKNSTGGITAWLSDSGNIFLKGNLEIYSNYQRTDNDEFVINFNGKDVLLIDKESGNMFIDGNILENQNSLTIKEDSDEFIIKDVNGNVVLYVNETGYVFMKGTVTASSVTGYKNSLIAKDNSGNNVARFDDSGDVVLDGILEQNSNHQRTANDEWIIRNNGEDVFILDKTNGNLYVDGTLFENQETLTPSDASDDFIVKDEFGNVVVYVNESGYLFLKGTLTENGNS